jgi:hypothetical protein
MSSFTEEQLHDLLGHDGPPSIRELALQSMTTRNDALKDDHRDRKHQHPTVLNQTRELMQQQIKAETRVNGTGLAEKQQHKPTVAPEDKRVHFAEEKKPSVETINLHQNRRYTTRKSNNFLLILLIVLAVSSLAYLYWPKKGSTSQ